MLCKKSRLSFAQPSPAIYTDLCNAQSKISHRILRGVNAHPARIEFWPTPLDAIRFVAEAPQQAQAPMALGLSDRAGSAFTTSVVNVRNCPNNYRRCRTVTASQCK